MKAGWEQFAKDRFGQQYEVGAEFVQAELAWLIYTYDPEDRHNTARGAFVDALDELNPVEFWENVSRDEFLLTNRLK